LEDHRISVKSTAGQLSISRELVVSIIHEDLDMRVACFLPGRAEDLSSPLVRTCIICILPTLPLFLWLLIFQTVFISINRCANIYYNISLHNVYSNTFQMTRQTSTPPTSTRDCTCSHKHTPLAQDIIKSNRFYCVTKQRLNNILIILWNFNFNSFNFKNLCNLARRKCKNSLIMT
jgi:hypothetical protein